MAPNRMKKCREKKKSNPEVWKNYLENDRERKKMKREIQKRERLENPKLLNEQREKERIRKQAQRDRKRLASDRTPKTCSRLGTYSSSNTLMKAVNKVKKSLPFSPSKKLAVMKELINDSEKAGLIKIGLPKQQKKRGSRVVEPLTKEKVLSFYENDKISRQAPGKRDKKSVKSSETGKRSLIQKRHMIVSISEAYEIFKMDHEECVISKSKFYQLRPENILPVSQMPHNVCVCKAHINFSSIVAAASKNFEGSNFPKNYKDLLTEMCCSTSNENCMINTCTKCKYDILQIVPDGYDLNKTIKWNEWQEINGRLTICEKASSVKDAIKEASKQLPKFKTHSFVKQVQFEHFETLKKNVNNERIVVQCDYAENYSIIQQDEIQSAHWQHSQVSVFTCVIWGKDKQIHSYAVVSDDLSHSKYSVWTCLKAIFFHFDSTGVTRADIFTDNCAAQFKSRYIVSNLCFLEDDLGFKLTWNNFAASHGKGAVDGVGGIVKGKVWVAVKSRKVIVNSAEDFYHCAVKECDKINLLFVPKENVENNKSFLDLRFNRSLEIIGIQSYHVFEKASMTHVFAKRTAVSKKVKIRALKSSSTRKLYYPIVYTSSSSDDETWPKPLEEEVPDEELSGFNPRDAEDVEEGDWVVVVYDQDWYPGVVERRNEDFLSVNFMSKGSGINKFFWPSSPDIQTVEAGNILCKVDSPPFPISQRYFEMPKETIQYIQTLYNKLFKF